MAAKIITHPCSHRPSESKPSTESSYIRLRTCQLCRLRALSHHIYLRPSSPLPSCGYEIVIKMSFTSLFSKLMFSRVLRLSKHVEWRIRANKSQPWFFAVPLLVKEKQNSSPRKSRRRRQIAGLFSIIITILMTSKSRPVCRVFCVCAANEVNWGSMSL